MGGPPDENSMQQRPPSPSLDTASVRMMPIGGDGPLATLIRDRRADNARGPVGRLLDRMRIRSLAVQFLLIGGLVSLVAMGLVGKVVTRLIEDAVTRNSAASTALYVDSVIAPLLLDVQTSERLSDADARALDETLGNGALGERLVSFRLWRPDGTILYASDKELVGRRFEPGEDLRTALSGKMVAEYGAVDDLESIGEREPGQPLLKIYNPILQPWTGEVVAVSEFYEVATDFGHGLRQARLQSWLSVAGATLVFFLILSLVVLRGSRTIDRQSMALERRVGELSRLLDRNRVLHERVQGASRRAAALNESYLRRIGADLHDGPAQLVALAALRLDSEVVGDPNASFDARRREISAVKEHLNEALREIRSISSGLVLPQLETAELGEILARVVRAHEQRTGTTVELSVSGETVTLSPSEKICTYRFVQEALNNSSRHAGGDGQVVTQSFEDRCMVVQVRDNGPGFDPADLRPERMGLAGLRDRVESLGGRFQVTTSQKGTTVTMRLPIEKMETE